MENIKAYRIDELTLESKTAAYESYVSSSTWPWNEMSYHGFISRARQERFLFTEAGSRIKM